MQEQDEIGNDFPEIKKRKKRVDFESYWMSRPTFVHALLSRGRPLLLLY